MSSSRFLQRNDLFGHFDFLKYIPDLIEFQNESFENFVQYNCNPHERKNQGLEKTFRNFFPITKQKSSLTIEYLYYTINQPKYTPEECIYRNCSYGGTLNAFLLVRDQETGEEQELKCSLGELPLITTYGTFINNGNERVFCSQFAKCPGVVFVHHKHPGGVYPMAKILPNIGSWIYIYIERNVSYISIDKRKKFHYTTFLLCFPKKVNSDNTTEYYTKEEILARFYNIGEAKYDGEFWHSYFDGEDLQNTALSFDVHIDGQLVQNKGEKPHKELQSHRGDVHFKQLDFMYIAENVFNSNGETIIQIGKQITKEALVSLLQKGSFKYYIIDDNHPDTILNTFIEADIDSNTKALQFWSHIMKIGMHNNINSIIDIFNLRFFNNKYYDLDNIGRLRLNYTLKLDSKDYYLNFEDLVETFNQLVMLQNQKRKPDDIDSFEHKRIRMVGDILESFFRAGIIKFEKNIKDRLHTLNIKDMNKNLADIFNLRIALYPILDSFYKVSQMYDNNNYLSSMSQKRKITFAQGTGSAERVTDHVRDINESKFGRVCPTTTPEGKKIGLVEHLALYAKVDQYGFICTPYYVVKNGKVTEEMIWLNALKEQDHVISSRWDLENEDSDLILGRLNGEQQQFYKSQVQLVDIAPNQIFSISASLIFGVEYTEPYRALTGSNMNCQAVPLVRKQPPFVSTGMDAVLADRIVAKNAGYIHRVDCKRIVIETLEGDVDIYELVVNRRTNTDTVVLHKPLVNINDYVEKGDVIADGFCTNNGELAHGNNLLVGYITDAGCYEDAFVISEKIIKDEKLASNDIQMIECIVRETRFGPEKNTRDIPNVNEHHLSKLDEYGIVTVGSKIKSGDIIVGKVTPMGYDVNVSSEQKLLYSIFGERILESMNSSLRASHNMEGIVVDVHILNRKGVELDDRIVIQIKKSIDMLKKLTDEKVNLLSNILLKQVNEILVNNGQQKVSIIRRSALENLGLNSKVKDTIIKKVDNYHNAVEKLKTEIQSKINTLQTGYSLEDNIIKIVRVFVARRQLVEPGDKLCGRHGNKGVISTIRKEHDMPYMKDGTPLEILISPLGIIARMNLGQLWETSIGYCLMKMRQEIAKNLYAKNYDRLRILLKLAAGKNNVINTGSCEEIEKLARHYIKNGIYVRIPQFSRLDSSILDSMIQELETASEDLKEDIYDGRTGEKLQGKVLCGYLYISALCHYVDKKMHVRSVGPYSLVTLQPLGGKARHGGQKFGEMEVWAIEAHGAAFTCMELGTKSDDPIGKKNVYLQLSKGLDYSLIVMSAGRNNCVMGNFKLLVFELRAAGFDLKIYNNDQEISLLKRKMWGGL